LPQDKDDMPTVDYEKTQVVAAGASTDAVSQPASVPYLLTEESMQMDREKLRIVIVEDNDPDVFMVREALEQAGLRFELQVLDDGEKAVDLIERMDEDTAEPEPNLVLLDLNLPRKTGAEILSRLRRSNKLRQTPVIILTSSDSPKDRSETAQLGATHYFQKPSKLVEFMKLGPLVRELLERQGQGQS
jgi:DNA-binding response OmpR family regulator